MREGGREKETLGVEMRMIEGEGTHRELGEERAEERGKREGRRAISRIASCSSLSTIMWTSLPVLYIREFVHLCHAIDA